MYESYLHTFINYSKVNFLKAGCDHLEITDYTVLGMQSLTFNWWVYTDFSEIIAVSHLSLSLKLLNF